MRSSRLAALVAGAGIAWYAADSLRHRREGAFGYEIGTELEVDSPDFLRAAEALTGAPISEGNEAELFINGDRIFPALLETIAGAERTLNVETYIYWRGEIAERDVERSEPIDPERWRRRGLRHRAVEASTTVLRREL